MSEGGVCFICGCCSDYFNETEILNPFVKEMGGEEKIKVVMCDLCYSVIRSCSDTLWIKCTTCGSYGAIKSTHQNVIRLQASPYVIGVANQVALTVACSQCSVPPPSQVDVIH